MANYLKFDGVNDQALHIDGAGTWPTDGVMTYEIVFTRGSVALNGGVADAFCPANGRGLYLTDTTFQLYWDFGSFRSTYSFNNPVVEGEDKKLTFEFLADKLTVNVYEDDILHTVVTSNKTIPPASDDVNVGTRYGGTSPCNALIRSIKRTVPSSAADSRFWDADSSDTSNTGQQPVLTETLNGFDATGVNMNTDGSDWVIVPEVGGNNSLSAAGSIGGYTSLAVITTAKPEFNALISGFIGGYSTLLSASSEKPSFTASMVGSVGGYSSSVSLEQLEPGFNSSLAGEFGGYTSSVEISADVPVRQSNISGQVGGYSASVVVSNTNVPQFSMSASGSIGGYSSTVSAAYDEPSFSAEITGSIGGYSSAVQLDHLVPVMPAVITGIVGGYNSSVTLYNGELNIITSPQNIVTFTYQSTNVELKTRSRIVNV